MIHYITHSAICDQCHGKRWVNCVWWLLWLIPIPGQKRCPNCNGVGLDPVKKVRSEVSPPPPPKKPAVVHIVHHGDDSRLMSNRNN